MNKYKVLLIGEVSDIVDRFFSEGDEFFECCTSSLFAADVGNMLKYFQPDAAVYCVDHNSSRTQMLGISNIVGPKSGGGKTPLAIIGSQDDYERYTELTGKHAELFIQKTQSMDSIFGKLFSYISRNLNLPSPKESRQPDEKKKIMVIDDSPLMLRTISGMLSANYKVATAISGKVARRYLASNTADLILLDYEMPDENGPAIFKKFKENPSTADIPVIFLTSVNDVDKVRGVLSLQPEGYLLKPVDMADLMEKIEEALSQGEI